MNAVKAKYVSKEGFTREKHGVFICRFAHVVGFSRQRALINLQIVALYQDPVSWEQVT